MIELRTLGAVDLRDAAGTELRSLLVQPKRTALLAYLAVAAPRGLHRRDSLLALFWPEHDAAHARNALRQALHGLRRALGDDVVVTRGDEDVGVDAKRCRCDVWVFEQALDGGDLERGVSLYGGPFLDAFFVDGAPEFERWVEGERDRLSRRYAGALEQLARVADTRDDHAAAVQWWSRLAEHAPYTARVAVRLMRALDLAGDRAGAIRHADQHAARLHADLDAEPDPEVQAVVMQLRTQPAKGGRDRASDAGPPLRPSGGTSHAVVPRRSVLGRLTTVMAGLAFVAVGAWAVAASVANARPLRRIAVLPLADQTGDSTQRYLVEGLHEAVITELGQLRGLDVTSRASVMAYQGGTKAAREIAAELKVDAFVEGAVFRAGDSVRVTLQLIDARHDRHVWARSFEGSLADVMALSRDAAQDIAREASVVLTPEDVRRRAARRRAAPEVNAAYLRARWQFNRNTPEGYLRSVAFYRQAIALDSTFAPAYAGLADVTLILGHDDGASSDAYPRARNLARRALEHDSMLGDAYAVLGHIAFEYDWDWAEAERMFRRAIDLDPSDARAHFIYGGGFLIAMGRFDEAQRELRQASELDPLSPATAAVSAYPALYAGRYADAEAELRAARRVFPEDDEVLGALGYVHALEGRYADAAAELNRAGDGFGRLPWVYAAAGQRDSAATMLQRLQMRARHDHVPPLHFALAYVSLGDRERALDYLETAYRERSRQMAWINVLPYFAPLRGHPRFQALLARMNFVR